LKESEKFFLPYSKNKCLTFPAEQLKNFLQLEALYLMYVTPLKTSDHSTYCIGR